MFSFSRLVDRLASDGWLATMALGGVAATCFVLWRRRQLRQTQAALTEAKARFETLVLASAEVVWTADAAGKIIENSPSWSIFTGQNTEEYLGEGWLNAIHPEDRKRVKAEWEAAVRSRNVFSTEYRLHHVTGCWRWMAAKAVPSLTDAGITREWVGMGADVTLRRQALDAARESEGKLREAQKIAGVCSWEWELDTDTLRWPEGDNGILGCGRDDAPSTFESLLNLVRLEDQEWLTACVEGMLQTGTPFHLECRIRRRNGDERIVEARGRRYEDAEGKPYRLAGTLHDITERRRIEEKALDAARESEGKLREAQKIAGVCSWEWELDTDTLRWPEGDNGILGCGRNDAPSTFESFLSLVRLEDQEWLMASVEGMLQTGTPFHLECRIRRRNGDERIVEARGRRYEDAEGKPYRLAGTLHDITERRRIEEKALNAVRESEGKLREAQKIAGVCSWEWELDTDTLRWPEGDNGILGCGRDDAPSTFESLLNLVHPEDQEWLTACVEGMLQTGTPFHLECRIMRRNGDERVVEARGRRYEDAEGNPYRLAGTLHDITERRQIEEKLTHSLRSAVAAVANTLEARDMYTAGHQQRVAQLAEAIAVEMKFPRRQIEGIFLASIIHDIGKIHVPLEILSKPGKLSDIEFQLVQSHAQAGYDILKNIDFAWPIAGMVHQHHERLNGGGYPQGLKGDEILPEARVITVADVVDAIMASRPYRPSLGVETALAEIEKNRGIYYDPVVVDACLRLFREKSFTFN